MVYEPFATIIMWAIVALVLIQIIVPFLASTKFFPKFCENTINKLRKIGRAINEARLSHEAEKLRKATKELDEKAKKDTKE